MVADRVEVETKKAGEEKAFKWSSDGKNGYEISDAQKSSRGTQITLFINEENKEFLEDWKLKELIKKYSNYISTPIMMREYDSRSEEERLKEIKQMPYEQINETKPLWKKQKSQIKKEEYKALYQSVSMDFQEPLFSLHTSIEGVVSYKSILFSPQAVNMYQNIGDPNLEYGPKLYIQNVLILEHAKEILPVWLRFISGVIETNDLPLNISREMLQSNATTEKIKKSLTKKLIAEFAKTLQNNRSEYEKFWEHYGKVFKEGLHYERELREDIAAASLFASNLQNKKISLDEYLEKAPEKSISGEKEGESTTQKTIYYIIAKSENEAKVNPFMAQFVEKNIDVLLLTDPIDSFIVQDFTEYKGAKLVSITSDDIELEEKSEEEKKKTEETKKEYKSLTDFIKNTLGEEKIEAVVLNENL